MSKISVITAVLPEASEWLGEAWDSLAQQSLPRGWSWEWLLQLDGPGELLVEPPHDRRVKVERNLSRFGPGISRTAALARLRGKVVKVLDADDQLTQGQLAREIKVFESSPEIGWVTSRVIDVLEDGSMQGFEGDPHHGVIECGQVAKYWEEHDYRASVHPATLAVRSTLLLGLGGWMALPASEDTGLVLALDTVSKGYFLEEPGLLYRKWPKQMTAREAHTDNRSFEVRRRVLEARIGALREWGVRWPSLGSDLLSSADLSKTD